MSCRTCRQRGAVYVEYLIATSAMLGVLFLPVPGGDDAVITLVLDGLRALYQQSTWLLSLP